uniref:Uncharacterized protein n=1 Tax=Arundo donax TaxID=35708 RepID=A0A0A8Y5R7_ARUDO
MDKSTISWIVLVTSHRRGSWVAPQTPVGCRSAARWCEIRGTELLDLISNDTWHRQIPAPSRPCFSTSSSSPQRTPPPRSSQPPWPPATSPRWWRPLRPWPSRSLMHHATRPHLQRRLDFLRGRVRDAVVFDMTASPSRTRRMSALSARSTAATSYASGPPGAW